MRRNQQSQSKRRATDINEVTQPIYLSPEQYRRCFPEPFIAPNATDDGRVTIIEVWSPTKAGEPTQAMLLRDNLALTKRGYRLPNGKWLSEDRLQIARYRV